MTTEEIIKTQEVVVDDNKKIKGIKPISIRMGNLKLVEFENVTKNKSNTYKTYKIERIYKDPQTDQWNSTQSFSFQDLERLQRLINGFLNERLKPREDQ